jgi:hypothetical protein
MKMESVKPDDDMVARGEALWNELQRVDELVHQPVQFTEVPRRRFAFWPDRQAASAKHAVEAVEAQQIAALNLLSEGVAFGRYGATMPLEDKLKILSGQYCDADADMHRATMGLARRDDAVSDQTSGRPYRQALRHLARRSHQVFGSWLGTSGAPLKQA